MKCANPSCNRVGRYGIVCNQNTHMQFDDKKLNG